jgi:hypothetical protein
MVGIGAENSVASIDNVVVQVLPPEYSLLETETFADGTADRFVAGAGDWQIAGGRYIGTPLDGESAISTIDLDVRTAYLLQLAATFRTNGMAGIMFDRYSDDEFKFAALSAATNQVIIGHHTAREGWQIDAVVDRTINPNRDYDLEVSLKGTTVSVVVDGQVLLGYVFNAVLVDGDVGIFVSSGSGSFDSFTIKTDDPAYLDEAAGGEALLAAWAPMQALPEGEALTLARLMPIVEEAMLRWLATGLVDDAAALRGLKFEIVDLPGLLLGWATGDTIFIDIDAAGFGWFVDATPTADEEYADLDGDGLLDARAGPAFGRVDLLSVVMHELGHALGFEHEDAEAAAAMGETLAPNARVTDEGGPPQNPRGGDRQVAELDPRGADRPHAAAPAQANASSEPRSVPGAWGLAAAGPEPAAASTATGAPGERQVAGNAPVPPTARASHAGHERALPAPAMGTGMAGARATGTAVAEIDARDVAARAAVDEGDIATSAHRAAGDPTAIVFRQADRLAPPGADNAATDIQLASEPESPDAMAFAPESAAARRPYRGPLVSPGSRAGNPLSAPSLVPRPRGIPRRPRCAHRRWPLGIGGWGAPNEAHLRGDEGPPDLIRTFAPS